MKLTRRITILTILIAVFAVIAPVVLLLALGYRINFAERRLVATGTLFIKTEPRDANVYLNDLLSETRTPVTFRLLLPGEYTVRIEKPGYQPWSKRFTIFPKRLTVAHDREPGITLLRSDISPRQIDATPEILSLFGPETNDSGFMSNRPDVLGITRASDGSYFVATKTEILRFDAASTTQEIIARHSLTFDSLRAIPAGNDEYFLLGNHLSRIANGSVDVLSENVMDAAWDNTGKRLFYRTPNELWLYYPERGEFELITRTSSEISAAAIAPKIGYAFYAVDRIITAIETNTSFSRNTYKIAEALLPVQKIAIGREEMDLYYLTPEGLISASIR